MKHLILTALFLASSAAAGPRARDLGVPFDGTPGPLNAITDVAGVEVGFKTLISGEGERVRGKGPVRTGVTAIFPRGKADGRGVFAGYFAGNGNGDMTGTHWVEEGGVLETPILITGTGSVGVVRDAAFKWLADHRPGAFWYPLVAETADATLHDMAGQHVTVQDTLDALDSAKAGPVAEGNVGGGTGMVCNGFKGGTGTASRRLTAVEGGGRRLHGRRAGAVQLWFGARPAHCRHPRRARDGSAAAVRDEAAAQAAAAPGSHRRCVRPEEAGAGR